MRGLTRPSTALNCPRCSAPYTSPAFSILTREVRCNYCGQGILLNPLREDDNIIRPFDSESFGAFMSRKGVPYDSVSGGVTVGGVQFFIDSNSGYVMGDGPEKLRQVVLRWIEEWMNQG